MDTPSVFRRAAVRCNSPSATRPSVSSRRPSVHPAIAKAKAASAAVRPARWSSGTKRESSSVSAASRARASTHRAASASEASSAAQARAAFARLSTLSSSGPSSASLILAHRVPSTVSSTETPRPTSCARIASASENARRDRCAARATTSESMAASSNASSTAVHSATAVPSVTSMPSVSALNAGRGTRCREGPWKQKLCEADQASASTTARTMQHVPVS
mmetsp:Transcript_4251/g.13324  ORF Transcript_4251/g.13324 Transcript_4251/m.13324 type:complete len:220 (+) Transcript_4251:514-1173(+)